MYLLLIFYSTLAEFTEIKINDMGKSQKLTTGCNAFRIRTNYQRTSIHFITESGSAFEGTFQYTDIAKQTDCDKFCPASAAVCGELNSFKSSELTVGACTSNMYLYINSNKNQVITITATYLEGPCDKIDETMYTKCGSMTYAKCDQCGDDCRIADCIKDKTGTTPLTVMTSLCLPSDVTNDEINERCKKFIDVSRGKWKDKCDDSLNIGSIGAGTIIILVLIMMSFFGFVGVLTYYNWKMKMTGVPPFKCLRCCPDILFPKPKPKPEASNYVPPEINLREFK